jgi:hypothetical protein
VTSSSQCTPPQRPPSHQWPSPSFLILPSMFVAAASFPL